MKKLNIMIALLMLSTLAFPQGIKISALPAASSLAGTESTIVQQGVSTKKATITQIEQVIKNNALPASNVLVMDSDSINPTAGSYTTRFDFEKETTATFIERLYKEQGGVNMLFPTTPNPVSNGSASMATGGVYFTLFVIKTPFTITNAYYSMITAGAYTANNVNSISLYKDDGAGNLTKVAETANSGTLWSQTALTMITIPFTSTYSALPGKYYVAATYSSSAQTTAPAVSAAESIGVYVNQILTYPISGKLTGQTAAPATTTVAAIRATSGNPLSIFLK